MDKKKLIACCIKALKEEWSVYRLVNASKKAVYVGVSKNPEVRYLEHWDNKVDATKYWDFEKDHIEKEVIYKGLTQKRASEIAHGIEKFDDIKGYKIIKTAGI